MIAKTEAKKILAALGEENISSPNKQDSLSKRKLFTLRKLVPLYTQAFPAPALTADTVITLLKVGLCQELSQRFVLEYCLHTERQNISQIYLANIKNPINDNHLVVYIGSPQIPEELVLGREEQGILQEEHAQTIEEFMKSNKEGLLVDPLLSCLGQSGSAELNPFLDFCQRGQITHVVGFRPFAHIPDFVQTAKMVKMNAETLARQMQPILENSIDLVKKTGLLDAKKGSSVAKKPSDISVSAQALIDSTQPKPLDLYNQAIKEFKAEQYPAAKVYYEQALATFQKKKPDSLPCANCYSGLVSCHREMKEYSKAIEYCEKAILILYPMEQEKLGKINVKYNDCLKLSGISSEELYQQAVDIYKNHRNKLPLAVYQLLYVLPQLKDALKQASCHSTLASCYEKLGQIEQAKEHLQTALALREKTLGEKHKLTQHAQKKLSQLLELSASSISFGPSK